ncbi:MAG: peptidoglycan DD-metalloendopeptidase family protein [bacterium]
MKGLQGLILAVCVCLVLTGCGKTTPRRADVPVQDGVIHTVKEGETLIAIARTYDVSTDLLRRVNGVDDPNRLIAGTRLFIPAADEIRMVDFNQRMSRDLANIDLRDDGLYHIVQPGETLVGITRAYSQWGVSMEEIQRVNNIIDASHIEVGQRLWIPRAGEVKDAPVPSVTIKTTQPTSEFKDNPNVNVQVVKQPTPKPTPPRIAAAEIPPQGAQQSTATPTATPTPTQKAAAKPTPTPTEVKGEEATFPREVKEFGPERFQWPLKGNFTPLREYSPSGDDFNPGIDLGVPVGTPVYAAAHGTVMVVASVTDSLGSLLGNYIIIYHGERNKKGIYTIYGHNSQNMVKEGQTVERGQQIATVGNTGQPFVQNTGVLHFEIREKDQHVDPRRVLPPL